MDRRLLIKISWRQTVFVNNSTKVIHLGHRHSRNMVWNLGQGLCSRFLFNLCTVMVTELKRSLE